MTLLIATGNEGKLQQFRALLAALPLKLVGPADVGLQALEVAEDGDTLEANAVHKARTWSAASGLPALADDTGLFVDALDGAPGVYPARWGGPGLSMAQRRQRLLEALGELPPAQRVRPLPLRHRRRLGRAPGAGQRRFAGRIAQAEMPGPAGFGYDSLFIPRDADRSWAQLPPEEKNRHSHRSLAAARILPLLRRLLPELRTNMRILKEDSSRMNDYQ